MSWVTRLKVHGPLNLDEILSHALRHPRIIVRQLSHVLPDAIRRHHEVHSVSYHGTTNSSSPRVIDTKASKISYMSLRDSHQTYGSAPSGGSSPV